MREIEIKKETTLITYNEVESSLFALDFFLKSLFDNVKVKSLLRNKMKKGLPNFMTFINKIKKKFSPQLISQNPFIRYFFNHLVLTIFNLIQVFML